MAIALLTRGRPPRLPGVRRATLFRPADLSCLESQYWADPCDLWITVPYSFIAVLMILKDVRNRAPTYYALPRVFVGKFKARAVGETDADPTRPAEAWSALTCGIRCAPD